jgi:aspartyl-tRNA(Asn)/glutamyl-tRNA(Gln) amidotransferase subunit C
MSLGSEDVKKIAHLAALNIEPEAIDEYTKNLSGIIEFVEQMNAVDTTGVKPMAHPQDLTQRLRVDEVTETDQRELFQEIAPAIEEGLYLVPRVIE